MHNVTQISCTVSTNNIPNHNYETFRSQYNSEITRTHPPANNREDDVGLSTSGNE